MKIRAPITKHTLEVVGKVIERFEDPSNRSLTFESKIDVSKVRIKQRAKEPHIRFQNFNLIIRRSKEGEVLLCFGDDEYDELDLDLVPGKTEIEIRMTPDSLSTLQSASKMAAEPDFVCWQQEIQIEIARVRVLVDAQCLPFQFKKKFSLFVRCFRTGKYALYLGDEPTGFPM